MPLKILLADDSMAIKKVIQLSLQDQKIELKNVSNGNDALQVAKSFKPDIAFVDVLLPQKSGYDVTTEMKKDPQLKNVPVILLWSAFMAFDEKKYETCGADAKLEKPFEAQSLREMVAKYVPAHGEPTVSPLEFEVPIGSVPPKKIPTPPAAKTEDKGEWSMSSFEDIQHFASTQKNIPELPTQIRKHLEPEVPTQAGKTSSGFVAPAQPANPIEMESDFLASDEKTPPPPPSRPVKPTAKQVETTPDPSSWSSGDSEWVKKDLGKFQVPIPKENPDEGDGIPFEYTENKIVDNSFLFRPPESGTKTILALEKNKPPVEASSVHAIPKEIPKAIIPKELSLEELGDLKLETRQIIEKAVAKIVPELAQQIIREELDRLLSEVK